MERAKETARIWDELVTRSLAAYALRMGVVTAVSNAMVQVQFSDATSAGTEWYATLAGFALETGDTVALAPIDKTWLVLGRVQTSNPIRAILPGQIIRAGSNPTIAVGAGLGSGGSLGATISGTDSAGIIQLTAGSSGTAAGVVATVTFANSVPSSNYAIQLRAYSNASRAMTTEVGAASRSTSQWTIQTSTAFTAGGVYQYLYTIDGYRDLP